jgi:hypothetical protein
MWARLDCLPSGDLFETTPVRPHRPLRHEIDTFVDLRSTFISNALASGLTVFETARVAGTSVKMIERHHGALLDAARSSLLERLERGSRPALQRAARRRGIGSTAPRG